MAILVTSPVRTRRARTLVIGIVVALAALGSIALLLLNSSRGLPYHDSFAQGKIDEWTAYDGNWNLVDGSVTNDSDERGAKLIVGSPRWRSYAIDADLQLIGGGDAGLLLRTSNIERGVDSYDGYYAGLRT